jgi:hypothetical protein
MTRISAKENWPLSALEFRNSEVYQKERLLKLMPHGPGRI